MIRLMTINDYQQAYNLWQACPGMGLRSLDDSRQGISKFLDRNPTSNFVYLEGERLIGVILSGHDGRRAYIYHALVDPAYRGQGIGHKLLVSVEEAMVQAGIHKIGLVVFRENQEGNDFWAREGYRHRQDLVYRNKSINEKNL